MNWNSQGFGQKKTEILTPLGLKVLMEVIQRYAIKEKLLEEEI